KVLERMANRRLMWCLETQGSLLPNQHGFRWGRSTHDELSELTTDIRRALMEGETVAALHMDIDAAFTSVNIKILLKDLKEIGMPEKALKWFTSYLKGRTVEVDLGENKRTKKIHMTRGLMQGGVLSPTLWNIYARFLLVGMDGWTRRGKVISFADDVTMYTIHEDPAKATSELEAG